MDSQPKSVEQQFLEAIALECNFTGDTRMAFLGRFDPKNASKNNQELAKFLSWNRDPVDSAQKLQDELGNIFNALEERGCTIYRKRGRAPKGQSPWEQAHKWLWEARFPEWKQQNQPVTSNPEEGNQDKQPNINELVREVRDRCCSIILTTYNHIQVCTPFKQIDLDWLFVPVFVQQEPSSQRESRQNFPPEPALEVIKRHQYLMILGKPGAGKSTLSTYLAATYCKTESQAHWIPVLLRLRDVDTRTSFNLLNELEIAFGTEAEVTQQILKNGKVFLILDGLDEVSSKLRQDICQEISSFVRLPYTSKVITTCRSDVKDCQLPSVFERVEIADFDEIQQNQFIENWFAIGIKDPKSWLALRLQQHPECTSQILIDQIQQNKRLQELAKTPILLNLICLVYISDGRLPGKRSSLYQRGLEILLEDWDGDRGIEKRVESTIYRNLSSDDKCKILAELARYTFDQVSETIAFEESTALEIIAKYQHYSHQESRKILEGIATDHGLIFRSARRKWEFSHLTFQEYFVARWFVQHQDWELLAHNVSNLRWREVFLLTSEIADSIDELLISMQKRAFDFIEIANPKIQNLHLLIKRKASSNKNSLFSENEIRAFYFALNLGFDWNLAKNFGDYTLDELDSGLGLEDYLVRALEMANSPSPMFGSIYATLVFCEFSIMPSKLKTELTNLINQLNSNSRDSESFMNWWKLSRKTWVENLRSMMIFYFQIGYDWQFNDEEKQNLESFFTANSTISECMSSNYKIRNDLKQEIEDILFLPIAEIEKRKTTINSKEV